MAVLDFECSAPEGRSNSHDLLSFSPVISRAFDAISRQRTSYNPDEWKFSGQLQERLHQVLSGNGNPGRRVLYREYAEEPDRLGLVVPPKIDPNKLRLDNIRRILEQAVSFIGVDWDCGGPLAQTIESGLTVETQIFPNRYGNSFMHRADRYNGSDKLATDTTISICRLSDRTDSLPSPKAIKIAGMALSILIRCAG